jgi:DNA topoisomerase-2
MASAADYKKLSDREHVLERPNMYVGETSALEEPRWVFDTDSNHMVWRSVSVNPGLYKIFDEVIVNARDALVRAKEEGKTPIKHIDVEVRVDSSGEMTIRVSNDGDGIPVEEHPTEKVWVPELIFGHLRTSSNYKAGEERTWGGMNGVGVKLANIFSRVFSLEVRDSIRGKTYKQTWRGNMSVCEKPVVRAAKAASGLVALEFVPDLDRFPGIRENMADMVAVLHTRVIETAALVGAGVKVSWNGATVAVNTFEKYVKLFLKDGASAHAAYEVAGPRWEVAAVLARQLYEDDSLPDEKHISFVNGIATRKGGKHVEAVSRAVLGDICDAAAKKKKLTVKPGQIKDSVVFFVNATIVNPTFDSQTKDCLTTPATKFGSAPKWGGKLVDGLVKLGIYDEIQGILDAKAMREAKKTDGKKRTTLRGLPKLTDALWAGTARSAECTLILTEGDSAATSAIAGLSVVGREKWGVFPLKGKLLNVRDISLAKLNANEEIAAIKRILGLEHGKVYRDMKGLRYGRVMIMADQDHDGSHIKGLIMNLIHAEWPSLMETGFIFSLMTPILKASRGGQVQAFYSIPAFEAWKAALPGASTRGWTIKYYKGLGTSTPAEAREWFQKLNEVKYEWDEATNESITLAFSKKRADDRKEWLAHYDTKRQVDGSNGKVTYTDFIQNELIHFSNADNIRSLPSVMDGLKPSQRKILYSCLKRNLRSEIRVAQLAGYVSEHAAYHHGEASLNSTIVGMAQTFVGANNINLLRPIGQFGSRVLGGKDSASPRYIHTMLEPVVDTIFRKEDAAILKYIDDDGDLVEPEHYLPVVPLIALNGCIGIGTGFSTDIPPYNPEQIVALLKARLSGGLETLKGRDLDPWWFGFRGRTTRLNQTTWATHGLYEFDDTNRSITIRELPVGTWSQDYKEFLDGLCVAGAAGLTNFDDLYTDRDVKFVLYINDELYSEYKIDVAMFEKTFRLVSTSKTTNMCCFTPDGNIMRYGSIGDILEAFYGCRLAAYEDRKRALLKTLAEEICELSAKMTFIRAIVEKRLVISNREDADIVADLRGLGLPPLSDAAEADSVRGYEYLLRMRIDRIKASAIQELDEALRGKEEEKKCLEMTTPTQLWLIDLADFEEAWKGYESARIAEMNDNSAPKTGGAGAKRKIRK